MDRRANRTALAREARRIAEEVEGLYIQLELPAQRRRPVQSIPRNPVSSFFQRILFFDPAVG
jgi:hypothetical protein